MSIENLENLPSPPGVAVKILEMYSQPEICVDDLGKVISADPALSARIIKYANSASFARRHPATSLKQAIMVLGAAGVKLIALSFSLTEMGKSDDDDGFSYDEFWKTSIATAVSAKEIFRAVGKDEEIGFLLGLLMNIGQIGMACSDPDSYLKLLSDLPVNDPRLIEKEKEVFGSNRFDQVIAVLNAVGFPESISTSLECLANTDDGESIESTSLKLANQTSYLLLTENPDLETVRSISKRLSKLTGFNIEQSQQLFDSTLESYKEVASVLSYENPKAKSLREIELEAKMSLIQETMALQMSNAEVQRENSELKDMAYIDALTGLGNRRQYDGMFAAEMERCARMNRPLALIVVDIDHFKSVNDTHGHAAGDSILANVASRLSLHIRSYDFLFRFGGEEFVLILPETSEDECRIVAERLRESIAAQAFEFEEKQIPVTISIGGANFSKELNGTEETLFKQADENLYVAKQTGRNKVVLPSDNAVAETTV